MKSYTVSEEALLKVLLHAAKYPTSAVNGVLLGSGGGADDAAVQVTDAVPVCHSFITLTPVMEAALSQVEAHAKLAGGGLRIVGYFQANERLGDSELGSGRRVADRVEAASPDAVAAVLDSVALQAALKQQQQQQDGDAAAAQKEEQPALQLFVKDGSRGWAKVPAGATKCPTRGVAARLAQLVGEGRHQELRDFEDHLDDVAADWLNPSLLSGPA